MGQWLCVRVCAQEFDMKLTFNSTVHSIYSCMDILLVAISRAERVCRVLFVISGLVYYRECVCRVVGTLGGPITVPQ